MKETCIYLKALKRFSKFKFGSRRGISRSNDCSRLGASNFAQNENNVSSSSVSFLVNLNIFDLRDIYYDYNFTGECYCIISAVETTLSYLYTIIGRSFQTTEIIIIPAIVQRVLMSPNSITI